MPDNSIPDGFGFSNNTPSKQASLRSFLEQHLAIYRAIANRNQFVKYHYIDLFAGLGIAPDGTSGSPLIFAETASKFGVTYTASLYENNPDTALRLSANVSPYPMTVINADNQVILTQRLKTDTNRYGIIYADPTHARDIIPTFDVYQHLVSAYPRMDVLVYLSFALFKRNCAFEYYERFDSLLNKLNKEFILVREPIDKHQWSHIVASNYPLKAWRSRGFYDLRTEEGLAVFKKLVYTKNELNSTQGKLF